MTRFSVLVLLVSITVFGTEVKSTITPPDESTAATFNKDVLPILQNNCQSCHRPGSAAPMSFLTYESTRPWAKAIKTAVLTKKMPPWFADPHIGEFRNAPKLTDKDIQTLAAWADSGAREGNAADKPADLEWVEGWQIKPDVVVSMTQPYRVAAGGAGEVREFIVPNPFKEDTWVNSIEIRPGNPSVVHHVIVKIPEQNQIGGAAGGTFRLVQSAATLQEAAQTAGAKAAFNAVFFDGVNQQVPNGGSYSSLLARAQERITGRGAFTTMEAVYAPGSQPMDFRYNDSAKLVRAGNPIRIEVHYTPNGKETTDQTMVGFTLANAPAQRQFVLMAPEHMVDERTPILANVANWETTGELTFEQDAELVWFMPHMHLRGKDMSFRLIFPDGREETVLSAKFNFNWQLGYELANPIQTPKGTRMIVTAHHDNSANNPMNPSPGKSATWGEMTSQEMMLPWFGVVVDRDATPDTIAFYKPAGLDSPALPGLKGAIDPRIFPKTLKALK